MKNNSTLKLTIDNSICVLEGLSIQAHKQLSDVLSYTIDNQLKYGGYKSFKRTLLSKNGSFPTGLLYLVERFLKQNKIAYRQNDIRRVPKPIYGLFNMNLTHSPYPEQKAAAEAAKAFKRGIITAPTGVGKSLIAALIINELQVPTLIIVPSLELKRQLTESLSAIFGKNKVGPVDNSPPIAVENVTTNFDSHTYENYDCVIIDEFHHSGAKTYRNLNKKAFSKIFYKFGLTATPFRSQENERLLMESVLSKVIYRLDYKKAVKNNYIVPIEAYYIEIPKKKEIEGNPTSWHSMYNELVVNNTGRNDIIADTIKNIREAGHPLLCLVKEIEHGLILSGKTGVHFANGINEETPNLINSFNDSKINALIGTNGVLGEGVDTKPAEYIIIAGLGKSKNAFMQQCGRGVRKFGNKESCKIIIFKDSSHKFTLRHFREQAKILELEYGVKVVKL